MDAYGEAETVEATPSSVALGAVADDEDHYSSRPVFSRACRLAVGADPAISVVHDL